MRYLCNILRADAVAFLDIVSRAPTQHPFEILRLESRARLAAAQHGNILRTEYLTLFDVPDGMHAPARKREHLFLEWEHAFDQIPECCLCLADTGNHFLELVRLNRKLVVGAGQTVLDCEMLLDDIT